MLKSRMVLSLALSLTTVALAGQIFATYSSHALTQESPYEGWLSGNLSEIEGVPIRKVEFSGNATTADKVVRRALSLNEEDLFRADTLKRGLKRLNKLGRFEKATEQDVWWQLDREKRFVDFVVRIKEKGRR